MYRRTRKKVWFLLENDFRTKFDLLTDFSLLVRVILGHDFLGYISGGFIFGLFCIYNHDSSTIADSSMKPSLQGDHFKIESEASHGPQGNLKSSAKGKYGDEGYEELDK